MHQKIFNMFQSSEAIQKLCVIVNDYSLKMPPSIKALKCLENRIRLHNTGMYHKNVVSVSFGASGTFNSSIFHDQAPFT